MTVRYTEVTYEVDNIMSTLYYSVPEHYDVCTLYSSKINFSTE